MDMLLSNVMDGQDEVDNSIFLQTRECTEEEFKEKDGPTEKSGVVCDSEIIESTTPEFITVGKMENVSDEQISFFKEELNFFAEGTVDESDVGGKKPKIEDDIVKSENAEIPVWNEIPSRKIKGSLISDWKAKCVNCSQIFCSREEFHKHYRETYHKVPVYQCSVCDIIKKTYDIYTRHFKRHIKAKNFRCDMCEKSCVKLDELNRHKLANHSSSAPFMCDICSKGLYSAQGLYRHQKTIHAPTREQFACEKCNKILYSQYGYNQHMLNHKNGVRKLFVCEACGKSFTQKGSLQIHHVSHAKELPFICDTCGKRCPTKGRMKLHWYGCHSDERPFLCAVCSKTYRSRGQLSEHIKTHSPNPSYTCPYCSKGFQLRVGLKNHINTHTGAKPYACNFCEKSFANPTNKFKHTRRKHAKDLQDKRKIVDDNECEQNVKCDSVSCENSVHL